MSWMVYGAYGYTGRLVAALAAERGELPVLAGRDERRLRALGERFELEHRTVDLSDPAALRAALKGVDVVAHCAGPFSSTSEPMVDACLATRTHYLDITGEIDVFEAVLARARRGPRRGGGAAARGRVRRGALGLPGRHAGACAARRGASRARPPGLGRREPGHGQDGHGVAGHGRTGPGRRGDRSRPGRPSPASRSSSPTGRPPRTPSPGATSPPPITPRGSATSWCTPPCRPPSPR